MSRNVHLYFLFSSLLIFGTLMLILAFKLKMHLLLAYLISVNITLLLLYMYDKISSMFSWLRVPENILHLLTILGATPMALLSQKIFSHKTSKLSFQSTFKKIVFFQVVTGALIAGLIVYMA